LEASASRESDFLLFDYNLLMLRKEETDRLLTLLDESIRQSHCSHRELERRMGLGEGYLRGLFKQRTQLRLEHVYAIAHALGVEPMSFFLRASPPRDPDWLLKQLGIRPGKRPRFPLHESEEPNLSRQGIQNVVRSAIRNELGRIIEERQTGEEEPPAAGSFAFTL
jgi:hypothetical protein